MAIIVLMIVGEEGIIIKELYYVLMNCGIGNVKICKQLISKNHVYVDDVLITNPKYPVSSMNTIRIDQQYYEYPFVYYMLNKPKGYICARRDSKHPCVTSLFNMPLSTLGRLDKDTTGLLILTNDKNIMKHHLLPESHISKKYEVVTKYPINESYIDLFKNGIVIDDYIQCLPANIEIIDDYHCIVEIFEGKYHQIKKMFLSLNNQVVELKRISFHSIELDSSLKEGEYRMLNKKEIERLGG